MKYRVELSARAELDINGILNWSFRQGVSTAVASRWHARLLAAMATLERDPQRCPLAPEVGEVGIELRELHFGRHRNVYRIFFIIEQRTVKILHIRHASRDALRHEDLI